MLIADAPSDAPLEPRRVFSELEQQAEALEALATLRPSDCAARASTLAQTAQDAGDSTAEMKARYYHAFALRRLAEDGEAEVQLRRALSLSNDFGDTVWRARLLVELGAVFARRGDLDQMLEYHSSALECFREASDWMGVARCLINISCSVALLQLSDEALMMVREANALYKEHGNSARAAHALWVMAAHHGARLLRARRAGDAQRELEEAAQVRDLMHRALCDDRSMVPPDQEVCSQLLLCSAFVALGDANAARQALDQADAVLSSSPVAILAPMRLVALAEVHRVEGDRQTALLTLEAALTKCDECGAPPDVRQHVLQHLGAAREALGDRAGALSALHAWERLQQRLSNPQALNQAVALTRQLQAEREHRNHEVQAILKMQNDALLRATGIDADAQDRSATT
jgi:tetratricopeptide (TPR) repeat protein